MKVIIKKMVVNNYSSNTTTQSHNQKHLQNRQSSEVQELTQRFVSDCRSNGYALSHVQVQYLKQLLSERSGRDHRNEQHQKPLHSESEDQKKCLCSICESINRLCQTQTHQEIKERL